MGFIDDSSLAEISELLQALPQLFILRFVPLSIGQVAPGWVPLDPLWGLPCPLLGECLLPTFPVHVGGNWAIDKVKEIRGKIGEGRAMQSVIALEGSPNGDENPLHAVVRAEERAIEEFVGVKTRCPAPYCA